MAKTSKYPATGFITLSAVKGDGLKTMPAAAVNIAKGDALHDNGAGFATNATTAFAGTFLGIAVADCDNSGGAAGDLDAQYIPANPEYRFIVAVEENAVITATARGTKVDLQSVNTIDISDTVAAGTPGFFIDEIDASADAVAVNTYGFAIGHFTLQ